MIEIEMRTKKHMAFRGAEEHHQEIPEVLGKWKDQKGQGEGL
jgi:hypothetical protein